MSQRSDGELAAAWQRGERDAFAELYERHSGPMFGGAAGVVRDHSAAADLVHDTFVRAAVRIAGLREPERVRAWLFAILRNESMDWHRSQGRERPGSDVDEMTERLAADLPEPHTEVSRRELSELVCLRPSKSAKNSAMNGRWMAPIDAEAARSH